MAISNLNLNVTANTARALADFNKFSRSLDNKFLVSGLKLDVVRGALSQINRDFQRAIGEQGLASASSLRAAQNQAALLTQTFKGFASESALAITTNIGTALNRVAVTAGGTMKDVQKTLLATPFISTRLSEDVRLGLSKGVLDFQKNIRRAGLGDNFGGVAQQFLMGTKTTMQMVQSGNPLEMFLGSELIKKGAGVGEIASPEVRSKLMKDLVEDSALSKQLEIAAKRAAGFRIVLEDMNSKLFNPESGIFGSLRKVVDAAGKPTTMFDEVEKLVEQVFGDNGMFATLVKSFRSVFGSGDPMRPFIDGVQFMTRIFKSITEYFNTPGFKAVLGYVKDIVERVTNVFTGIYQQIRSGGFSAGEITRTIGEIGNSIRGYIKQFGEAIRNKNVSGESGFAGDILGTLVEEVGRTAVVLIKELLMTLVDKVPEIATAVLPAINKGINAMFTEIFGSGLAGKVVKMVLGFVPGPIGMIARASAVGDVTGGGGSVGSMLAMGAAAALTPGSVMAARGFANRRMEATRQQVGGYALPFRYGYGMARGYSFPLNGRLGRTQYGSPAGPMPFTPGSGGSPLNPGPGGPQNPPSASPTAGQPTRNYNVGRGLMARIRNILPTRNINKLGSRQYLSPIGPLPEGSSEPWSSVKYGSGHLGSGYSPYMRSFSTIRGPGTFPSAYDRMRAGYMGDNNEDDYPGIWDRKLSRTPGQESIDRYNRRYGVRGRMSRIGRGIRGFGRGALITGAIAGAGALGLGIFGGPGALGQTLDGQRGGSANAMGSILGGAGEGAMTGAQYGMFLGPKGALAGAAIGAVLGGIAPLMDKGVRDGVGTFISGMGNTMKALGAGIVTGITEFGNGLLSALSSLPRMASGVMQSIYNTLPPPIKAGMGFLNTAWSGVTGFVQRLNIPSPFYAGKDYAGPAMALEARMSGRRPMVVNDGEFVIPRDGFPTLAGIVGDNLRSTGAMNHGTSQPVQVNVSLAITTHAVVADPNELANALRDPVYKIIGEAWNEAYNSTRIHRPQVS
jgi:hypothetical protein